MLRLLADENLNGDIVRGLMLRRPDLDLVRVQEIGLRGKEDPEILEEAAERGRILLTHDRATMPDFAYERLAAGKQMPGVFVFDQFPIGEAINEILLLVDCSEQAEWDGLVVYLPL